MPMNSNSSTRKRRSMSDLITDVVVLRQFYLGGTEKKAYYDATLASLVTSTILQLVIVIGQNKKKGILRIVKETMIVSTGFKGPWDAYRVAIGAEQEKVS